MKSFLLLFFKKEGLASLAFALEGVDALPRLWE
jgi:hypothetical protein